MERIDLFDRYINNQLSDEERQKFDAKLKENPEFAGDFNIYLMTVDGIIKEAQQDDMDFGIALKSISKEQLCEIIGKNNSDGKGNASSSNPKSKWFKPWMWQAGSAAAIIVIGFTFILNMYRQSQNAMYDNIYASAQFEESHSRGSASAIDITKLSDSELKAKLPEMEKNYNDSEDPEELYLYGYPLAMAYIRLHQPKPALEILNNMVTQLQNDDSYESEVKEMRLIINLIK